MHIRIAALIFVISALFLAYNPPSRSEAKYAELNAICLGNKGGTTTVVSACSTLMEADGVTPERRGVLLRARGWAYYCDEQHEKALSDYSSALALLPDDGITILRRAIVQDALGNTQAAEADFAKRLLMDPDGRDPLFYKAKFDQRHGNTPAAISGYEKVLKVEPGHREAGRRLINAHYEIGGFDGSAQFSRQAKQRWPDEEWVHIFQTVFDVEHTGHHENALEAASEWARLRP